MSHYDAQREDDIQDVQGEVECDDSLDVPSIAPILAARGAHYGNFATQAQLSQVLKNNVMQHYFNTHGGAEAPPLPPFIVEAVSVILHKVARIANGDSMYIDSWRDIAGYSELVVEELLTTEGATDAKIGRAHV